MPEENRIVCMRVNVTLLQLAIKAKYRELAGELEQNYPTDDLGAMKALTHLETREIKEEEIIHTFISLAREYPSCVSNRITTITQISKDEPSGLVDVLVKAAKNIT